MKKEEKMNEPTFVYCDKPITDKVYVEWLSELKQRFQQSQIKAAVRVNTAMLEFYWGLGRDIVALKAESKWGSGFFNQLSLDMRAMFPEETGFSSANLRYMKRWYEFYYQQVIKGQQVVDQIVQQTAEELFQRPVEELSFYSDKILKDSPFSILQRPIEELKMPEMFGRIPWGQHIEIFTKCKSLEEALFYINKTIENNWSRPSLVPEFAGKLNFYVTAADKLFRGKDDNPSVGLLICKTAKKTIVEWSLQDIQKPLGVSTYQLQEVVDRTVAELELRKKQREELK